MMKAAFQGTCAVCQGTFKVTYGKLALHGYLRPGVGYINGRCWGGRGEPWEVSSEIAQYFLTMWLRPSLLRTAEALARYDREAVNAPPKNEAPAEAQRRERRMLRLVTPEPLEGTVDLVKARAVVAREHAYYETTVKEFEDRIAAWTPGVLQPVVSTPKYLRVSFVRGVWCARSERSGKVLERGRLLQSVFARVGWEGWTLPPGTVMPEEYKTSDLYRMVLERPDAPETVTLVGPYCDPERADMVLRMYETLTPAQRSRFDLVSISWVDEVVEDSENNTESLRHRIVAG